LFINSDPSRIFVASKVKFILYPFHVILLSKPEVRKIKIKEKFIAMVWVGGGAVAGACVVASAHPAAVLLISCLADLIH
jgi:hypothetical protein